MKIMKLYFLCKNEDLHLRVINLQASTHKATHSHKAPVQRQSGHSQSGTAHKIFIIKISNNCSDYLHLTCTEMSLQNKIHSHC